MNVETLMREHLESLADEVALTPIGPDAVMKRVRRHNTMWKLALAATLVVALGVVAFAKVLPSREPTGPVSGGTDVISASSWNHVVISPDAGAVIQIVGSRSGGFILLTEMQRWFFSEDGETWVEHEPTGFGPGSNVRMIANVGDRIVAAGVSFDGSPLVATSLDGITWEGAGPGDTGNWFPVSIAVVDDTVLVPFVNYGPFDSVVYRFTVADLWTSAPPPEPGSQILTIGVLEGSFVAQVVDPSRRSQHRDYRSDDGLDWQRRSSIPLVQVNKPLTDSIIEGPAGSYLVSLSEMDGDQLMRSSDGEVWELALDTAFEFGPSSLVAGEYGIFAALPTNDNPGTGAIVSILYSPDGESWTVENLGSDFARTSRFVVVASDRRRIIVGGGDIEGGANRATNQTEVWVTDR